MVERRDDGYKVVPLVRRRFLLGRSLLHRRSAFLPVEVEGRVDEGDVRKRLGEVAQLPLCFGLPFLREKA